METSVLTISLKEYKKELDDLRASLAQLEKGSAEYNKMADEIRGKQQALNEAMSVGKEKTAAAAGSYNAISQEMSALRKEWKATNDEARRNELGVQIAGLNEQLKQLDASTGNFQRSVGNYAIAGESMKSQLKALKEEMAQLLAQGVSPTDERLQELTKTAGVLQDAMGDATSMIKEAANDTSSLATMLDVAKTGTAVFGAWKGAMSAFGIESEETTKAIQKLQGVLTMLNSLQQIQTALVDKGSATYRLWNKALQAVGLTSKATAASTTELATAEVGATTATKAATAATNLFKKALIATGIGAVVALLGALIANLDSVTGWFKNLIGVSNDYSEANENIEKSIEEVNHETDNEIKIMKAQGVSENEIIKFKQKRVKAQINEIEAKIQDIKATNKQIQTSNNWYKAIQKGVKYASTAMTGFLQPVLWAFDKLFGTNWSAKFSEMTSKIGKSVSDWALGVKSNDKEITELQGTLKKLQGTMKDLGVDLQVATIQENKKTASTKESTKSTQDEINATNQAVEAKKNLLDKMKLEKEYMEEMLKAQGVMTKERQKSMDDQYLENELNIWKEIAVLYKEDADKYKDGTKEKLNALKGYYDSLIKITELNNRKNLNLQREATKKEEEEWEKQLKLIENRRQLFSDLDFDFEQIAVGQGAPIIEAFASRSIGFDFTEELDKKIDEINKKVSEKIEKDFGKYPIGGNELAEKYKKYLESQEKNILSEWTEFPRERFKFDMGIDLDITRLNQQFEYQDSFYKMNEDLLRNHLATITEGTEEYENTQKELGMLEMEHERLKTEYIIEQQSLLAEKRKSDIKAHKDWANQIIKDTTALQTSIGNLMGAIGDVMQQNLEQKMKNAEISEEEANDEFERIKKVQLAQLWISTLSGAMGAFVNDMGAYAFPFNSIIAGIDLATTLAAGVAQHRAIKNQDFDSAASGAGGSTDIQDIAVSPILNEGADVQTMQSLGTEQIINAQGDNRVYILQQDISKSQKQVEVRQSNTTF